MLKIVAQKISYQLLYCSSFDFSIPIQTTTTFSPPLEKQLNIQNFDEIKTVDYLESFPPELYLVRLKRIKQRSSSKQKNEDVDKVIMIKIKKEHMNMGGINIYERQLNKSKNETKFEKITRFEAGLTEEEKQKNSINLMRLLNLSLKQDPLSFFIEKVNYFNENHKQKNSQKKRKNKKEAPLLQSQLFLSVHRFFVQEFKNIQKAREYMLLFSRCNPLSLPSHRVAQKQQLFQCQAHFDDKEFHKDLFIECLGKNKNEKNNSVTNQITSNITQNFLENLNKKQIKNQHTIKNTSVCLKLKPNEQKCFSLDEASIKRVEKKLFGAKRLTEEGIIFTQTHSKSNEQSNKFGQNWVYAYDLPYQFGDKNAQQLVNHISQRHGPIIQYEYQSFSDFMQKSNTDIIYSLPNNYMEENSRKRVKIERSERQIGEYNQNLKQKTLANKILEKVKYQKGEQLNRSTMVFKFKNKSDKEKFLSAQMRLYGLCVGQYQNVRFEEAQSKSVLAISNLPWECSSSQIIAQINSLLSVLNIKLTGPEGIISTGYIFLQFKNFEDALKSKIFLNNFPYQNKILKARLSYGSSYLHEGKYRYNFKKNHYKQLLQKLEVVRSYRQSQLE